MLLGTTDESIDHCSFLVNFVGVCVCVCICKESTMVLEAVMVCVDNSEWMRNGDYPPSRLVSIPFQISMLVYSNEERCCIGCPTRRRQLGMWRQVTTKP